MQLQEEAVCTDETLINESVTMYQWPSLFCNIRQSLRTNADERERCRRPRLLYNRTDMPLAWGCSLAFPWCLSWRGVCLWSWPGDPSCGTSTETHPRPIRVKPRTCTSPRDAPTVSREPDQVLLTLMQATWDEIPECALLIPSTSMIPSCGCS